jgi:cytochrome c-type biogenesis protein CcmH/NrfG
MLERMLSFFPDDAETWLYLGLVNHRSGRGEAAAKSFAEGLERLGDDARAGAIVGCAGQCVKEGDT